MSLIMDEKSEHMQIVSCNHPQEYWNTSKSLCVLDIFAGSTPKPSIFGVQILIKVIATEIASDGVNVPV